MILADKILELRKQNGWPLAALTYGVIEVVLKALRLGKK